MPSINFYTPIGKALLGETQKIAPFKAPTRGGPLAPGAWEFGRRVVPQWLDALEKRKDKKSKAAILAALVGDKYEYDPSKAAESFTPSQYLETQRAALSDQAQAQPERVSALDLSPDDLYSPDILPPSQPDDLYSPDILKPEELIAQPPSPEIEALFGSDPTTSAAMQAALIATPEEELEAWAGSPEERAGQERTYTETVHSPEAVRARMAALDPRIKEHPAFMQFQMSDLARKQRLSDEETERGRTADLLEEERIFQKELKGVEFGFKKGDSQFDKEDKLRKEFEKGTKDFIKVRDAFGRIQASASDPSAAGDLALIFNFMKVLDPGSTVREGEFATAASAAGIDQRIRAQYNKVIEGTRLGDTQRADFVNRAQKLYASQLNQYQLHEDYYSSLATKYNLDPTNVVYGMGESITVEEYGKENGTGAEARTGNETGEKEITEDDIQLTMKNHNMTREDVMNMLREQGRK